MKKYILASAIASVSMLLTTSCSNNLEEKIYSTVTTQSYKYSSKDFDSNICGAYSAIHGQWGSAWMSFWELQEVSACGVVIPPNITGWNDGGIHLQEHFHKWNSELGNIGNIWSGFYEGVVLCNYAIEKIENNMFPNVSDTEKTVGLSELRTLRAFYYWLLMDNFGDIPLVASTKQEMPEKSSRKEVYDFIVNELTESIPNLSEEQGGNSYGRFNKWAGKCLLANVYLNAGVYTGTPQWEACKAQCDEIINSGKCELENVYRDNFRASGTENSKEILMTIPYDYDKNVLANWLYMNSWHKELKKKFLTDGTPNEAGGPKAVSQFIDSYDPDDGRIDDTWLHGLQYDAEGNQLYCQYDCAGQPLNFTKDLPSANYTNEMEGYRMNKYEVEQGARWSSSTDIPIFRYSDVLLMKAECLLRLGQSGAGALVTQVRQRDFKNNPEKAVVSDDDLKKDSQYPWGYVENYKIVDKGDQTPVELGRLFDEYMWEFAYESHARRDMIRFGIFTKKSWLSHKPNGDYRTVFPIPESALTANPKLSQNPDYVSNN